MELDTHTYYNMHPLNAFSPIRTYIDAFPGTTHTIRTYVREITATAIARSSCVWSLPGVILSKDVEGETHTFVVYVACRILRTT